MQDDDLIADLLKAPGSFSAGQVVRLLLNNNLSTDTGILYKTDLLPGYKPMAVVSIQKRGAASWQITLHQGAVSGALGVMPRHLWDDVLRLWLERGEAVGLAFLEIFNQRSHQLSYRTLSKYDMALQAEGAVRERRLGSRNINEYLAAITGTTGLRCQENSHFFQYGALLGMRITCPDMLAGILSDYFDWFFKVIPSDQGFEPLSYACLTSIGLSGQNQQLGREALIGRSATVPFAHLDVRMMADKPCALRHIRDQNLFNAILELVQRFIGYQVKIHLQLEIDNNYLPALKLSSAFQLGLNSYLPVQGQVSGKVVLPLKRRSSLS